MADISRREFAAVAAAATAGSLSGVKGWSASAAVTAEQVIDRIKKHIGIEWNPDSVDGVKAGDPSTIVRGIITTSMATLAVLQQGVKAGANVFITAHPTFYARADVPIADPVCAAKSDFITRSHLVVFRLSDHWRQRRPDPFVQGIAAAFRWSKFQSAADPARFDVPALGLGALAASVSKAVRSRGGIRVVGDPSSIVRRVGVLAGTTPLAAALKMLPNVDVIVAGEVREWESVEYVRDTVFSGEKKGLILVGRSLSQEPGMAVCAHWLKTLVSEVPIRHISAGDPYWRPSR